MACPPVAVAWAGPPGRREVTEQVASERLYVLPTDPARPLEVYAGLTGAPQDRLGHMHQAMELGIVVEGALTVAMGEHERPLSPGDAWLCAMWEHHRWWGNDGCRVLCMAFLPETVRESLPGEQPWLGMFAASAGDRPGIGVPEARTRLLAIAHDVIWEASHRSPSWEHALYLALLRLLLELNRYWVPGGATAAQSRPKQEMFERMRPAVNLVRPGLGRRVSVGEAAKACGLSEPHFHTLFQRVMGTTFGQFCVRSRIGFASNLLLTSSLPLDAIADSEGFTDASHLHRSFVRIFGCTPAEYRRQGRVTLSEDSGSSLMATLFCGSPQSIHDATDGALGATRASAR